MKRNMKVLGAVIILSVSCSLTAMAGWQQSGSSYWYEYDNGGYAKSGIKDIGGTNYSFNDEGYMLTGWQYISFRWYYFDPASGAQAFGWRQADGQWYYLDPSDFGAMYTSWLDIGKNRYYLNEQGVMQTGVFYLSNSTVGSDFAYEADENGVLIRNTIRKNGAKTIKYDENGIMMYRNDTTKAVADSTGDSQWQYVRNQADMLDQQEEYSMIIGEAVDELKNGLYDEYRSKVTVAKKSEKETRRTAWMQKANRKLAVYISAEEIEAYIQEVELGRYIKAKTEDYEYENQSDIDYYYDNYID